MQIHVVIEVNSGVVQNVQAFMTYESAEQLYLNLIRQEIGESKYMTDDQVKATWDEQSSESDSDIRMYRIEV